MKKIDISNYKSWREVKVLLATFLCLSFIVISCKKKDNLLGTGVLPDGTTLNTRGIDTFQLFTSSIREDSVSTLNPSSNLLGTYIDPVFGKVDASFYTQVAISNLNPTFGNEIKIDSMVFSMLYSDFYGSNDEQTIEIFRVTEDMDVASSSTFYAFSNLNYDPNNLVANTSTTFIPSPNSETVVDGDTVSPQLRVQMDTNFARTLIEEAQTGSSFSSTDNFKDFLKGFYIRTNNPTQGLNEGGISYFNNADPASGITIYYQEKVNGNYEKFTYSLLISGNEIDFNHFEVDQTGTNVENVINNPSAGLTEYYAQAFTTRAKINIPSLNDIPYGAIVQEATLTLPISYYTTDPMHPSLFLSSFPVDQSNAASFSASISTVSYDDAAKAYKIDVRNYIQKVIAGEIDNQGLFISPTFFNTTASRIVFNGPNTTNKRKPTLNILLTDN